MFSENLKHDEDTRFNEMNGSDSEGKKYPALGEEVDNPNNKNSEKKKEDPEVQIADIQKRNQDSQKNIEKMKEENPDWPAGVEDDRVAQKEGDNLNESLSLA